MARGGSSVPLPNMECVSAVRAHARRAGGVFVREACAVGGAPAHPVAAVGVQRGGSPRPQSGDRRRGQPPAFQFRFTHKMARIIWAVWSRDVVFEARPAAA